ncbi:MAG: glycosyl transferase [Acidobacteria bacterium]|nr:glycosyl transferase [Acidobacteriota bacterium]
MSDFYQTGEVATLHSLDQDGLERLEGELEKLAETNPIALVLPALYSEFEGPAMKRIRAELARVRYLQQIVVTLGRADEEQFEAARSFFDDFPHPVTFIWNSGERIQDLYQMLENNGLPVGEDGKGRSCWMAYGYVLASGLCNVIALHDCDILNYNRRLLARLCYPVANPNVGFDFCKGYYARVTDRMHGRVTRLFVTPLVRSLLSLVGNQPFLRYLDSFRYPLAGEFAMRSDLARANRIPGDWGLEVGVLAEVYRNRSVKRVCQADLSDNYEHKHQPLSEDDPGKGLMRMACDIAKTLFRVMGSEGTVFTESMLRTLQVHYVRTAEDTIHRYYADARLNGLKFDRHEEEQAVAAFACSLRLAADCYVQDPLGKPLIPNWNRVVSAIPDFLELLLDAVQADNQVRMLQMATA